MAFTATEIGGATLYLGECLEVMAALPPVTHVMTDPPYEDELHAVFGTLRRNDGRKMDQRLEFAGVNNQRAEIAKAVSRASSGWAVIFTLAEGVRAWRDALQAVDAKYDSCLAWVKPDSLPRLNGQGPARGFECAVTAWCGGGATRMERRRQARRLHASGEPFRPGRAASNRKAVATHG